jgi:hypothetical protein
MAAALAAAALNGCPADTDDPVYTVTFLKSEGGEALKTETVAPGGSATPPYVAPPSGKEERDGKWEWSGVYENVNENITIFPKKWIEKSMASLSIFSDDSSIMNVTPPSKIADYYEYYALSSPVREAVLSADMRGVHRNFVRQSDYFVNWFKNVADTTEGLGPVRREKINTLLAQEKLIRNSANTTQTTAGFIGAAETAVDDILGALIAPGNRTEFDKYKDAYSQYNYLKQRHYNVFNGPNEDQVLKAAEVTEFVSLCDKIGSSDFPQPIVNGDGTEITNADEFKPVLENYIKNAITNGLALDLDDTEGQKMVSALVRQITEDIPQFRAFIDDMEKQEMKAGTTDWILTQVGLGPFAVVQSQQSDTKAAHLAFERKTAPGAIFRERREA